MLINEESKEAYLDEFREENIENGKKEETFSKSLDNEKKTIEKIKEFIAKIIAMQEELKDEENENKIVDELDSKETSDELDSKETSDELDSKKTSDELDSKKTSDELDVANQEEMLNKTIDNEKSLVKDKKAKKVSENKPKYMLEYYDLPYRYNETIVKILAQTPKKLFVYWDVSDNDRKKYKETFGEDFFEKTYPVLLVYNEDMKYVKEVPINDFANSWYIDINDPKTRYIIQLGRKFKETPNEVDLRKLEENSIILKTDYLPFANSNSLEAPNDHVLLEYLPRFITFRNVKTNEEYVKDIRGFKDAFGKNYKVKEFYKNEYKDELEDGIFDMANPSSSSKLTSSSFK